MTEELQNDLVPWTIKCLEYIHVIYCSKFFILIKESRKLKTIKFQFIERTLFYSLTNDFTPVRFLKDGNDRTENGMVRLMKKIIIVLVLFTPEFN